jgi:hypothetical protein
MPQPTDTTAKVLPSRPRSVPGYRPLRKLGEGTYGEVWLYEVENSNIRVAIKFFSGRTTLQWLLLQAEVKQLSLLDGDPGIVQIKDVEPDATPPYYVMTYATGGSLDQVLAARGTLPVSEALAVFREVAEALAYVHAKGVRHCDLKPGNVLLDARGRALLADFGQAHLTSDATPALGTFFYMAPEQADLQTIPDTRWDVYGLGALFYAMLTGRPPREDPLLRDEIAATANLGHRLHRYREGVRRAPAPTGHRRLPGMDRRLARLIDRCLELDPERRPHDGGAVVEALRARDQRRRRRPLLLFGLLAPVLLLAVLAVCVGLAVRTSIRRSEAALAGQVQQSDRVSARLVAHILERELTDRVALLERRARQPELAKLIRAQSWDDLDRTLQGWHEAQQAEGRELFSRWFIADADGVVQSDHPTDPNARKQRLAWRDWFHGAGDRPGEENAALAPLRHTHVSQPFVAEDGGAAVIGVSAPVFGAAGPGAEDKALGVLVGVVRLADLHGWLGQVDMGRGFAVVVDDRGFCLLHRDRQRIGPRPDANPPRWADDCPTFRAALAGPDGTAEYADPVDGGRLYLAGYTAFRVGGQRWGALVQHERDAALEPVAEVNRSLVTIGLWTLAAGCLLTAGMWGWLHTVLRREDRPG